MEIVKEIETTRGKLEIYYDEYNESPREWDNATKLSMFHNRYIFPTEHDKSAGELWDSMRELEKTEHVFPVYMYEHGSIAFSLGREYPFDCPWDSGQAGIISVPKKDFKNRKEAEKIAAAEIETFQQYANGEIYCLVWDSYLKEVENNSIGGIYADSEEELIEAAIEHVVPKSSVEELREKV